MKDLPADWTPTPEEMKEMSAMSDLIDQTVMLESQLESMQNRAVTAEAAVSAVRKWCAEAKAMQTNPALGISTYAIHTVNAYHSAAEVVLGLLPKEDA